MIVFIAVCYIVGDVEFFLPETQPTVWVRTWSKKTPRIPNMSKINRNASTNEMVRKIDEKIEINGMRYEERTFLNALWKTRSDIFSAEQNDDHSLVVAIMSCLN